MINEKKFLLSLIIFTNFSYNLKSQNIDVTIEATQNKNINIDIQDEPEELDLIDELIEAPKNPDAKPSEFKIPNVVREYGMRMLEMVFYVKNGMQNQYRRFVNQVKYVYFKNFKKSEKVS